MDRILSGFTQRKTWRVSVSGGLPGRQQMLQKGDFEKLRVGRRRDCYIREGIWGLFRKVVWGCCVEGCGCRG